MNSFEWQGQSPLAKWFAITSTILVALLAILAGTTLLGAERITGSYDIDTSAFFDWLKTYGFASVIFAWVLHMASMLLLMGYVHNENRTITSLVMTGAVVFYLLFVVSSSMLALPMSGMKSMM